MTFVCLAASRNCVVGGFIAAALLTAGLVLDGRAARAADDFPFDRDLLLDTAPMGRAKRVPILNVAPDGAATIDLWCRTVRGFVQLTDGAMTIEPGPVPEGLPQYVGAGQCTPERMRADYELLTLLIQVTGWGRRGSTVILDGPARLRFHLSDH
jgi:hypothetical protein